MGLPPRQEGNGSCHMGREAGSSQCHLHSKYRLVALWCRLSSESWVAHSRGPLTSDSGRMLRFSLAPVFVAFPLLIFCSGMVTSGTRRGARMHRADPLTPPKVPRERGLVRQIPQTLRFGEDIGTAIMSSHPASRSLF